MAMLAIDSVSPVTKAEYLSAGGTGLLPLQRSALQGYAEHRTDTCTQYIYVYSTYMYTQYIAHSTSIQDYAEHSTHVHTVHSTQYVHTVHYTEQVYTYTYTEHYFYNIDARNQFFDSFFMYGRY